MCRCPTRTKPHAVFHKKAAGTVRGLTKQGTSTVRKGRGGKDEASWAPPVDLDGPVNETPYRSAPTLSPEGDASSVRHQTLCTQGNMGTW